MGIVSSAFAGHCAELTAGAYPRPLPGGSPIKMCRNARRKKSSAELNPNVKITALLIMGTLQLQLRLRLQSVLKKIPFTH